MFGNPLRVLVVDDNESVRRSICQILRAESDVEIVCEATDGADSVDQLREHRPDVVLLDITMPKLNGLEVVEASHCQPALFSGLPMAALAAGVSGYTVKSNVGKDLIPELRKIQRMRLSA